MRVPAGRGKKALRRPLPGTGPLGESLPSCPALSFSQGDGKAGGGSCQRELPGGAKSLTGAAAKKPPMGGGEKRRSPSGHWIVLCYIWENSALGPSE